jgi:hypothetical protein
MSLSAMNYPLWHARAGLLAIRLDEFSVCPAATFASAGSGFAGGESSEQLVSWQLALAGFGNLLDL